MAGSLFWERLGVWQADSSPGPGEYGPEPERMVGQWQLKSVPTAVWPDCLALVWSPVWSL